MIPMRFREISSCAEDHQDQDIIVLEDASGHRTLAIAADPDESCRLVRELSRGPGAEHPIYDFLHIAPTRVVLEYTLGEGLGALICFSRPEGEVTVPCYPSDALAIAHRTEVPIYVSAEVFSHVEPFGAPRPEPDERGELAKWLERISPADFSSSSPSDRPAAE